MPSDTHKEVSPWKHVAGNVYERTWDFEYVEPMYVTVEQWQQLREDPYFRVGMAESEEGQLGTYINTEKKLGHRVFLKKERL